MPPQAKNTTLGQYDPQKLTPKTQTGNIGIHNVTYILHKRFGENRTYIITVLQMHTQTRFIINEIINLYVLHRILVGVMFLPWTD